MRIVETWANDRVYRRMIRTVLKPMRRRSVSRLKPGRIKDTPISPQKPCIGHPRRQLQGQDHVERRAGVRPVELPALGLSSPSGARPTQPTAAACALRDKTGGGRDPAKAGYTPHAAVTRPSTRLLGSRREKAAPVSPPSTQRGAGSRGGAQDTAFHEYKEHILVSASFCAKEILIERRRNLSHR